MSVTGDLCEIRGEKTLEWKIKDFLLLSDKVDIGYHSPQFDFSGASWTIWIYPNGTTCRSTEGWISLFVFRICAGTPVAADFSFSLKNRDGKSDLDRTGTEIFHSISFRGFPKFIRRSELIESKSELLPSDILTVICTLKNSGENDATGKEDSERTHKKTCADAFAQTNEERGNEVSEKTHEKSWVDAFAQTNEGTGICKLKEDFKDILLNGNVSDIVLKVDGQEFKSHRSILAARSPVFLAMMMHDTKEKATGVVDVQDVDPKTFPDFLNYLYTGSLDSVTSKNAHKLYATSDLYQVNDLKRDCLDYMLNNISVDNFCDVFTLSLRHSEIDLKEACIKFFAKMSLDIIKTSKWQIFLCGNPITGNELFIKHLELNK